MDSLGRQKVTETCRALHRRIKLHPHAQLLDVGSYRSSNLRLLHGLPEQTEYRRHSPRRPVIFGDKTVPDD